MEFTQEGFQVPHRDDMANNVSIDMPNNEIQGVHGSDIIRPFPLYFFVVDMLILLIEEDRQHQGRSEKNDKMVGNLEFASTQRETLGSNGLAIATEYK